MDSMAFNNIRNFCIIAHIDHGKSTLADRFLELTGTVEARNLKPQMLDMMPLERERGITIKLTPVRMQYKSDRSNKTYILNLIDTPGHVDFTYEVSRTLAAVEGAIILVDATQGVQAQTLANLHLAREQKLAIIPVINKIDLPQSDITAAKEQMVNLLGVKKEEILLVSAKTGQGVKELLEAVVERVPASTPPQSPPFQGGKKGGLPLRALIFDSTYDEYRGVVAYVRVVDGEVKKGDKISFFAAKIETEVLELGYFIPTLSPQASLATGEIGYIVTGLKDLAKCRVGDTVIKFQISNFKFQNNTQFRIPNLQSEICNLQSRPEPLPGYREVLPMVFASVYPSAGYKFEDLRKAMGKLRLNDASLSFEPEQSQALGFGFRVGVLGLLHLEIMKERLKREFGMEVTVTVPQVAYRVTSSSGAIKVIKSVFELPPPSHLTFLEEPWIALEIISPKEYLGGIMGLVTSFRGLWQNTTFLDQSRVMLNFEMPMVSLLKDFYDKLKSVSSGYASLSYQFLEFRRGNLGRLDILLAGELVEPFSTIVEETQAYQTGKRMVERIKELLPKQLFEIKIQACFGGRIIAAERLGARRKDVTGYLYGGDVTRKMKLLKKQKEGKKRLAEQGHVAIPSETYFEVFKVA
jgi:GTP-binding protein LepA